MDDHLQLSFAAPLIPLRGHVTVFSCGAALYWAKTKIGCDCGWPTFYDSVDGAVREQPNIDRSNGFVSKATDMKMVCDACDGHLGHIFRGEGF